MSSPQRQQEQAVIVFSASATRFLSTDECRLPATHVGVRRVRPSNQVVKEALKRRIPQPITAAGSDTSANNEDADVSTTTSASMLHAMNVCFMTTDEDGVERRMTKQEKKAFKFELKRKRAEVYKELKQRQKGPSSAVMDPEQEPETMGGNDITSDAVEQLQQSSASARASPIDATNTNERQYHTLTVSQTAIEEELAELRGASNRIPPVVLSAPMANEALRCGILNTDAEDGAGAAAADAVDSNSEVENDVTEIDDSLSAIWAKSIQEAMKVAEVVREAEDMRPMAYKIVPEVWRRLRPDGLNGPTKLQPEDERATEKEEKNKTTDADYKASVKIWASTLSKEEQQRWSFITTRPLIPVFDDDISIVYKLLYRQTNLHVSCGSKFGCDLLLYDGSREERHAFAGLRVCSNTSADGASLYAKEQVIDSDGCSKVSLPLPTSYDLAGYVRCLNTAGKLALLATVVRSEQGGRIVSRVAIVDLALEKILSAPTHKRKKRSGEKRQQVRKEGGENLDKKRG